MEVFAFFLAGIESQTTPRQHSAALPVSDITGFAPTRVVAELEVIADEEFNIGHAWLCRHQRTGAIFRVSPEFGEAVEFVNSNQDSYLASRRAAVQWSEDHDSTAIKNSPACINVLEQSLHDVDELALAEQDSYWPSLLRLMRAMVADADDETEFWFAFSNR